MELNRPDRWIADRLSALEPEWRPDFVRGRKLLDAGLSKRAHPRNRTAGMVVTAAVVLGLAAVAIPQSRALAQQLWYHLILKRADVVRVDFSDLPLHAQVTVGGAPQVARSLEAAAEAAGFQPYLPSTGVLLSTPSISIMGPVFVELTIHVGDLQAALRKVGAGGVQVPPEWEASGCAPVLAPW